MRNTLAILLTCGALLADYAANAATTVSALVATNQLTRGSLIGPVSVPTNASASGYVSRSVTAPVLGAALNVPVVNALNFRPMTNSGPNPSFTFSSGMTASTATNGLGFGVVTQGTFQVPFPFLSAENGIGAAYISATNYHGTKGMWFRAGYTNGAAPGGDSYPNIIWIVGDHPLGNVGGSFSSMWHITVQNGSFNAQHWDSVGAQTSIGTYNFSPGWDVGGESRLVGWFFGDNTLTFFGNIGGNGFVTMTNSSINSWLPTNGAPSYLMWEIVKTTPSTNVIFNAYFDEIGVFNSAAAPQKISEFASELAVKKAQSIFGYTTTYGSHDALTLANMNGDTTANLLTAGTTKITGSGYLSLNGSLIRAGTGSPEGVLTAPVGTLWLRTDGSGAGTSLYGKTNGSGNTGWYGYR